MGWWQQNRRGESFAINEGPEMVWGDGPADILADACDEIAADFLRTFDRLPTNGEIRAGLEFHLLKRDDNLPYGKDD